MRVLLSATLQAATINTTLTVTRDRRFERDVNYCYRPRDSYGRNRKRNF